MARKKRGLTSDEQNLWDKVIKQVETINEMPPMILSSIPAKPPSKSAQRDAPKELKPFKIGAKSTAKPAPQSTPSFIDRPNQTSPNMDRRNFQRLLKGQLDIDGTLDLHGMTADQARMQLHRFLVIANQRGHRLLLIITGKGNKKTVDEFNRPRSGVLRSGVPEWLKTGPLSDLVLQVTQAHGKHGGSGAYYVYLRRKRSYSGES